ncbi:RNA-splicing ligase RtcB [Terracoccus sp. 273MFTsu3.1]|uniref:RNA-splicing ligase RtcB n=1 Tax=Terracoccus sp. 273MFTsu3.1 TaxID=1172188 RepID=UPI0003749F84|nr:RNA-splicing ligase RtcB [Terracoccus sp. 273MFTsu3.1]
MKITVIAGRAAEPTSDRPSGHHEARVFDSDRVPADRDLVASLNSATLGMDLVAPPVVLPDFHHKSAMEMPSSIAVATAGTIRPTLTSSSVNCGMALIALGCDRPSDAAVSDFYRRVRERYPYPTTNRRDLSYRDVIAAATEGAGFAVERNGVDPAELERVEESGRIDLAPWGGGERLVAEVPALTWQLARLRFGTVGPTNHFVELQVVEEILDPVAARQLGVHEGQVTLQYHAGGGVLTGEIGHLFARRRDTARVMRAAMAVQKPLFHLATARSTQQVRERMRLFFTAACPPVGLDSDEGKRLMLANAAAMNYGFAFRMATYQALRQLATEAFGGAPGRLVVDSPHNSIYEEDVAGERAVVHRHNSCRAYPAHLMAPGTTFAQTGQAVLLPGTHRTSSYLAVAGPSSGQSLHSACHGAGTVIDQFATSGASQPDPAGRSTLRFRYDDTAPCETAHLDDAGVNAAMSVLSSHRIIRPVARMRPFAVLH